MLRIHLILMRIRIQIRFRIQVISLRCTEFLVLFFFAYFYPKTWWTIQKWGNFYNLSFFKNSDLCFRSKIVVFQFLVGILSLWIWIQEANILRIQRIRIRILSTDFTIPVCLVCAMSWVWKVWKVCISRVCVCNL